jgi:hypothetical protein
LAQNKNLSLKARGLMLYLLSMPPDWEIKIEHLKTVFKEKRCAILSALKELKNERYVHLIKRGFKEGWDYYVFEEPQSEEEFKIFLRTNGKPNCSVSESFENQQLLSTNTYSSLDIQKKHHPLTPSKPRIDDDEISDEEEREYLKKAEKNSKGIAVYKRWKKTVLANFRADQERKRREDYEANRPRRNCTLNKAFAEQELAFHNVTPKYKRNFSVGDMGVAFFGSYMISPTQEPEDYAKEFKAWEIQKKIQDSEDISQITQKATKTA